MAGLFIGGVEGPAEFGVHTQRMKEAGANERSADTDNASALRQIEEPFTEESK